MTTVSAYIVTPSGVPPAHQSVNLDLIKTTVLLGFPWQLTPLGLGLTLESNPPSPTAGGIGPAREVTAWLPNI